MSGGQRLQVLCFALGGRTFALDIMGIQEILRNQRVTAVPHTPPHIAGVVNLRGALISVVDLHRALLGNAAGDQGREDPKLVVVHAQGKTAGLLVDRVLDVVSVPVASLTPVPGGGVEGRAVPVATFHRETGEEEVVVLLRLAPLLEDEVPTADSETLPPDSASGPQAAEPGSA